MCPAFAYRSLGLVLNAIVLWNTRYMNRALDQLRSEGFGLRDEDVARLSGLLYKRRYHFRLSKRVRGGRLRPLREGPPKNRRPEGHGRGSWLPLDVTQRWQGASGHRQAPRHDRMTVRRCATVRRRDYRAGGTGSLTAWNVPSMSACRHLAHSSRVA